MNFQKVEAQTFSDSIFSMQGITKKAVEEHLKLYQGYVAKYNEINEKLEALTEEDYTKANQTFSTIRELKVELTFAWGGIVNHEIYFNHLGGKGGQPGDELMSQIKKDFGSFETFKKDIKATGIAARGWVWTAWNEQEGRLFNYIGDAQNTFPVWYAKPIMALDTYEHAYFMDFGSNRGSYIDTFFENMNWNAVEMKFADILGAGGCCGGACS
jgi:superoxide dismutase, Fe-Mn family